MFPTVSPLAAGVSQKAQLRCTQLNEWGLVAWMHTVRFSPLFSLYFLEHYNVVNDQVTRHLAWIFKGIYALWLLTRFSNSLVLNPSELSKRTKIGLNWSITSQIKLYSYLKVYLKMPGHGIKMTLCETMKIRTCSHHKIFGYKTFINA